MKASRGARTPEQDKAYEKIRNLTPKQRKERFHYSRSTLHGLVHTIEYTNGKSTIPMQLDHRYIRKHDTIDGINLGYKGDENYMLVPKTSKTTMESECEGMQALRALSKLGFDICLHGECNMSCPEVLHFHVYRDNK